jgi:hypothetical protein
MRVELENQDWNQLLAILAQAPWHVANPIIMKIGEQLRQQGAPGTVPARPNGPLDSLREPGADESRQRPS